MINPTLPEAISSAHHLLSTIVTGSFWTVAFTAAHLALFVYTRRKYVRKYKAALETAGRFEVANIHLRAENHSLKEIVDNLDTNQ